MHISNMQLFVVMVFIVMTRLGVSNELSRDNSMYISEKSNYLYYTNSQCMFHIMRFGL